MKILKINLSNVSKEQIDLVVNYFRKGKVIVYPTDTIYGLGCIASNRKAINKIYKIKQRSRGKPLLVLVSSLAMLKKYCFVSKKQEEYLKEIWALTPQPPFQRGAKRAVSVVLKSKGVLPKELTGSKDNIAVRLPKDNFLIKIIRQVNTPIVSTSLNISGRNNLTNISKIDKYFEKSPQPPLIKGAKIPPTPFIKRGELPDLVINAGKLIAKPSKLIDLRDINNIKILRN